MPKLRNGSKWDLNPGSLDCESGILPLSYLAPAYVFLRRLFFPPSYIPACSFPGRTDCLVQYRCDFFRFLLEKMNH